MRFCIPLCPRFRKHSGRQSGKTMRSKQVGVRQLCLKHDIIHVLLISQQLWLLTQNLCELGPSCLQEEPYPGTCISDIKSGEIHQFLPLPEVCKACMGWERPFVQWCSHQQGAHIPVYNPHTHASISNPNETYCVIQTKKERDR